MKIIKIGKENSTFQEIFALKNNRQKRNKKQLLFVEGVQNIKNAIDNNWEINSFIFADFERLSNWAKNTIKSSNATCYELSSDLMEKLSDKDQTSEIIALIKIKNQDIKINSKRPVILLLDRPSKKGNFGTMIRSCDAFNVDLLLFMGHSVDIYDPKVIVSSMGSFFRVPFMYVKSNNELLEFVNTLKKSHPTLQIISTTLQTDNSLETLNTNKPTLLMMGNEAEGLSNFLVDLSDESVKINMRSGIDSLNGKIQNNTLLNILKQSFVIYLLFIK